PVTVNGSTATISGKGWVDIQGIRVKGNASFLPVTWVDVNTWQVTVPVPPGDSTVILQGVTFSGVVSEVSIAVNNTTTITPASATNLVVTEIMYHPGVLTPAEVTAGFTDPEQFEYLEVMNIGAAT